MGVKSKFTPNYQNFFDFDIKTLWCNKPIIYNQSSMFLKKLTIKIK